MRMITPKNGTERDKNLGDEVENTTSTGSSHCIAESRVGGGSAARTAQGSFQKEPAFSVFRRTEGD